MCLSVLEELKKDEKRWESVKDFFSEKEFKPKTILLNEGEVSKRMYFVKKGCLRLWFNKDGKDISFQFFFENQAVASLESFMTGQKSMFSLETIESSKLISINKSNFEKLNLIYPEFKTGFQQILIKRLSNYTKLFLSRIKDKPRERYEDLLKNYPQIFVRIPHHYIASYLGITPISLSRIINKK